VTPTKTCLDAETLAAWVDGGLDARAAAMAEAHVSSCPRCQEIAGLIVKTIPAAPVEVPWYRSFGAAWLVPLTAGVAAVGLWMIVPTDRATAPPTPTTFASVPEQAKVKAADELKPAAPAEEARAKEQPARARDLGAKNEAPKLLAKQDKDQEQKRFDERLSPLIGASNADANKLRVQAAPPATAVADAAVAAAPPSPSAAAAPAARAAAEAGRLEAQAPARKAFAQAAPAREATSPDGSIRWRLTAANALERSFDNGRTWVPIETGAGGPLASIQAIDARTAIVTTISGRQFQTLDAGASWKPIN
jgi:hypothetical protein